MKIKLDENMPAALADSLRELGHDVHTVPGEGLAGFVDPEIWAAAQRVMRFLITQDLDFSNIAQFAPGYACGNSVGSPAHTWPPGLGAGGYTSVCH